MTPLQYISVFITTTLLGINVEQTNIYSFQAIHKSINTNRAEITSWIGMNIKMGILQLPSYKLYWSQNLLCPRIAGVMPRNCYQELLRYLHFLNNDSINTQDKLAKIRPLISMVREEFVKTEPEEYNSVFIPSKANYLSLRQYNPKKLKMWGLKNFCLRWHLWFNVWLLVYDGKTMRGRWWKIWSFIEICASCCKAMQWSSWSQKL